MSQPMAQGESPFPTFESTEKTFKETVEKIIYRGVKRGISKSTKKVIKSSGIHISHGRYTYHVTDELLKDLDLVGQTRLLQRVVAYVAVEYADQKRVTFAPAAKQ